MNIKIIKNKSKKSANKIKIAGELFGIILGIIILVYILPVLPFVTDRYSEWVQIGVMAAFISGLLKILALVFSEIILHRLFIIFAHIVSLFSTFLLYKIFPFDFSLIGYTEINLVFSFTLLVALFAIMIAIFIEFVKIIIFSVKEFA